jgi:hypothetical protein
MQMASGEKGHKMTFPQALDFGKRLFDGQTLDELFGAPVWGTTKPLEATVGGTRLTSTKIVESVANVATVGAIGAGVTLPVALPGKIMLVYNNSATDMRVFADGNSMIDGVSGDVGILQRGTSACLFVAQELRKWTYSFLPIASSAASDYISAYDTTIQPSSPPATAANEQIMTFNTVDSSLGISIVGGSKITVTRSGVYNLQFSAQFDKTDSGQDTFEIWLKKNGQALDWTNTSSDANNNNAKVVAAWNFVLMLAAGDYLELAWWSADVTMRLFARAAQADVPGVSPARPAIPSIIVTMTGV